MSKQIIAHLGDLYAEVEIAKQKWHDYTESLSSEKDRVSQLSSEVETSSYQCDIKANFHDLGRLRGSLQSRLDTLAELHVTHRITLGTTRQIIGRLLPSQTVGLETAACLLLRTLDRTAESLASVEGVLIILEQIINLRFARLQDNYKAVVEIVQANGETLDMAVGLNEFMTVTEEITLNGGGDNSAFADLMEVLRDNSLQWNGLISVIERQILAFKKNMTLVGVNVPRQTLITEFLEA